MEKRTYKIAVLSDLNSATDRILKTTVKLSKIVNGEIEMFNVKKPTDIVDIDNQLSAMRSINTEHSVIDKKLKKLIDPISKGYEIDIKYSFAFGNIKNEINRYIEEHRPDIIVLGRRKYKPLNFVGDNITEFVLGTFDGPVLVASDKQALEPEDKLSLGVLNGFKNSVDPEFTESLMAHVQKPIKSFKFVKSSNVPKNKEVSQDKEMVEYVFEYNDGAINSLGKYLSKNKVDLLCLDRGNKGFADETNLKVSEIRNIINRTKVSILVSGMRT